MELLSEIETRKLKYQKALIDTPQKKEIIETELTFLQNIESELLKHQTIYALITEIKKPLFLSQNDTSKFQNDTEIQIKFNTPKLTEFEINQKYIELCKKYLIDKLIFIEKEYDLAILNTWKSKAETLKKDFQELWICFCQLRLLGNVYFTTLQVENLTDLEKIKLGIEKIYNLLTNGE